MPKVKICCIQNMEEAELAINAGADAVGLVSEMPSGPGVITETKISEIAAQVPEHVDTFLLTSKITADEILVQYDRCKTTTIQLVDSVSKKVHRLLKEELPDVKVVQVVHVTGRESVEEALSIVPYVDALLLDSGNPGLDVKKLGGTGQTHNWKISRKIVQTLDKPVYLAGGLNAQNITEAIRNVNPYGVDICSGLRTNGELDREKATRFFEQMHAYNLNP